MNNKELILKRLLEEKHISIDEMFILNEKEISQPTTVVIKDLNPYPIWQQPHTLNPFYYTINTGNINPTELKSTLPPDYKMN
jgi:hypothetical protein